METEQRLGEAHKAAAKAGEAFEDVAARAATGDDVSTELKSAAEGAAQAGEHFERIVDEAVTEGIVDRGAALADKTAGADVDDKAQGVLSAADSGDAAALKKAVAEDAAAGNRVKDTSGDVMDSVGE